MNAIEAMRKEVKEYQLHDLPRLALPPAGKDYCMFVGAGDSYAAALAAQYASSGRALACHPADIILDPSIAVGRDVYVVSISGNTRANVLAARAAKKQGARTTAVTTKPSSRLALECDRVIELKYRTAGVTTAGTISFASSMLTCLSITGRAQLPADLGKIYEQAKRKAEQAAGRIDRKSSFIILGDGLLFPVATYGALKLNEVFGARAFPHPAEEFCHSPLFGARKGDQIIQMGTGNDSSLSRRLSKEGMSSTYVAFDKADATQLLLQSTFFMQLLVLALARRQKLKGCYFVKNKKMLRVSSDFIYG